MLAWLENLDVDAYEVLRTSKCCACGKQIDGEPGERMNLVDVRRKPKWKYPVAGNALVNAPESAVAVLCDECIEAGSPAKQVVELRDGAVVYHNVKDLEELPKMPTYVIGNSFSQGDHITCLFCGNTSYNTNDVINKYCGCCHRFHEA